jgi:hypothetical protein
MPSFLCKFMCSLVISAALFSLAPRAAADDIVILPNLTLTGASVSFGGCWGGSEGTVTLCDMTVNVPLAGNPNLAPLFAGEPLPQVIAEFPDPTDSLVETVTFKNCYITSESVNSGTETIDFAYEQVSYAYEQAPQGSPVPEPGSLVLTAMGLAALMGLRVRKARTA